MTNVVYRPEQRRKELKDFLTVNSGVRLTYTELGKMFNCSPETSRKDVRMIADETGATIDAKCGFGFKFTPSEEHTDKADKEKSKASDMKNAEGYPDPTAGKAIKTYISSKQIGDGDVWYVQKSDGFQEIFLVLKTFNTYSLCLNFLKEDAVYKDIYDNRFDDGVIKEFDIGGIKYLTDITKIFTKPNKYFVSKKIELDRDTYKMLCGSIGELLGCISPVEHDREIKELDTKISYLIKREKERLMKHKIEIYEKLLFERRSTCATCEHLSGGSAQ